MAPIITYTGKLEKDNKHTICKESKESKESSRHHHARHNLVLRIHFEAVASLITSTESSKGWRRYRYCQRHKWCIPFGQQISRMPMCVGSLMLETYSESGTSTLCPFGGSAARRLGSSTKGGSTGSTGASLHRSRGRLSRRRRRWW